MALLMLFRHAKAAAALPAQQDFDRPLTERGRNDASRIGKVVAEIGVDQAIVSAAKRTCETWEIAARNFRSEPPASIEHALYLCRPNQLIERIRAVPDSCRRVVLIGHNPCWHEVALWLAAGADAGVLQHKFPTGALAIFSLPGTPWAKLEPKLATLERFVTPGTLP
jgi:phosphohistidine phosphatase